MASSFLESNLLSGVPSPPCPQNRTLLPLSTQHQKLQRGQQCDANSWKVSEEAGGPLSQEYIQDNKGG